MRLTIVVSFNLAAVEGLTIDKVLPLSINIPTGTPENRTVLKGILLLDMQRVNGELTEPLKEMQ